MAPHKPEAEFDDIAPAWYGFRHYTIFRTELESLSRHWHSGRLLNAGCGHGADFLPFRQNFELFGIDISSEMLRYAEKFKIKHRFDAVLRQEDMRSLDFPDNYFDFAIAVASLHHLDSPESRRQALAEIHRVVRPDGEIFLTVWNACQPRFWFSRRDTRIPWKTGDKTVFRYYHLFTYREIERLAKDEGFTVMSSRPEAFFRGPLKYFSRNICLHLRNSVV
ncbi:Methyltransferase type 11 [Dehalogenimonas lykanthroporepellens BL-DC-9]|nr:Methyltransferase type 11 [Dehalogenimonas lykanthroporepellens BL-DC-9]